MNANLRLWAWGVAAAVLVGVGGLAADPPKDADDGAKKLASAPPAVLKTVPEAGADNVDPNITEVRVTFNKEMAGESWSWATDKRYGDELEAADKVHYDKDKKTCVLPVKLAPNSTYAVWLNAGKFQGFCDADGHPSVPYLLVFRTGKGK